MKDEASFPIDLYAEVAGQGFPCLLLPGLATDAFCWTFQVEPLSRQSQLVLCDPRGVGRSPIPTGPYCIRDMVEDVVATLDRLGLTQVDIVGHSMGGVLAQQLALRHPHRVRKLVLVCSFLTVEPRSLRVLESWARCLEEQSSPELLARCLFPWLYSEAFFRRVNNFEQALAALQGHPYPMTATGVSAQLEALRSYQARDQLGSLKAPTMVVQAEFDALVSTRASRELQQAIPGANLVEVAACGHACMLENPEGLNRVLLDFLGTQA